MFLLGGRIEKFCWIAASIGFVLRTVSAGFASSCDNEGPASPDGTSPRDGPASKNKGGSRFGTDAAYTGSCDVFNANWGSLLHVLSNNTDYFLHGLTAILKIDLIKYL